MNQAEIVENIQGAQAVVDWFGHWPQFHDAEVVSLELQRSKASHMLIHAFRMTDRVGNGGLFDLDLHAIVTFTFDRVTDIDLHGFRDGNILFDLELQNEGDNEYVVAMSTSYGLEGTIRTRGISVSFALGIPEDSRYRKDDKT